MNAVQILSCQSSLRVTPASCAPYFTGPMLDSPHNLGITVGHLVLPFQSISVVQGTAPATSVRSKYARANTHRCTACAPTHTATSRHTCVHTHTHTHTYTHTGLAWANPQVMDASATARNERLRSTDWGRRREGAGKTKGPGLFHPGQGPALKWGRRPAPLGPMRGSKHVSEVRPH